MCIRDRVSTQSTGGFLDLRSPHKEMVVGDTPVALKKKRRKGKKGNVSNQESEDHNEVVIESSIKDPNEEKGEREKKEQKEKEQREQKEKEQKEKEKREQERPEKEQKEKEQKEKEQKEKEQKEKSQKAPQTQANQSKKNPPLQASATPTPQQKPQNQVSAPHPTTGEAITPSHQSKPNTHAPTSKQTTSSLQPTQNHPPQTSQHQPVQRQPAQHIPPQHTSKLSHSKDQNISTPQVQAASPKQTTLSLSSSIILSPSESDSVGRYLVQNFYQGLSSIPSLPSSNGHPIPAPAPAFSLLSSLFSSSAVCLHKSKLLSGSEAIIKVLFQELIFEGSIVGLTSIDTQLTEANSLIVYVKGISLNSTELRTPQAVTTTNIDDLSRAQIISFIEERKNQTRPSQNGLNQNHQQSEQAQQSDKAFFQIFYISQSPTPTESESGKVWKYLIESVIFDFISIHSL
eukprot:TRINITY_DN1333_c0_g1_i1.p1 TRINITY_DN1333_c0_g1~~TRINITY_DN1333_c0_g1_i1.p1  ORF type:complete len:458 (-),score=172.35 TRINITY_DN1333_c0_g1_i1:395-1768(-)